MSLGGGCRCEEVDVKVEECRLSGRCEPVDQMTHPVA
jgi:hypothetical protein